MRKFCRKDTEWKKKKKISISERFKRYEGETKQEEIWPDEVVGKEE